MVKAGGSVVGHRLEVPDLAAPRDVDDRRDLRGGIGWVIRHPGEGFGESVGQHTSAAGYMSPTAAKRAPWGSWYRSAEGAVSGARAAPDARWVEVL